MLSFTEVIHDFYLLKVQASKRHFLKIPQCTNTLYVIALGRVENYSIGLH
jgi:hypothetical protein